jgi:hypothetical protein
MDLELVVQPTADMTGGLVSDLKPDQIDSRKFENNSKDDEEDLFIPKTPSETKNIFDNPDLEKSLIEDENEQEEMI